jgi:Carboxypeptidase regulatory-like domain
VTEPRGPALVGGIVSDPQGRAVPAARVWFAAGPVSLPDVAALTDNDGAFVLSAPESGDYTISCVASGFAAASLRVSVASGQRVDVHVRLKA